MEYLRASQTRAFSGGIRTARVREFRRVAAAHSFDAPVLIYARVFERAGRELERHVRLEVRRRHRLTF